MTNQRTQLGIMKAKPITDHLVKQLPATCLCQPKLRGQRMRTQWVGGLPILMSSYGVPFSFLEHIQQEMLDRKLHNLPMDGELYYHHPSFTQEHLNSILNRSTNRHPDSHIIEYHVFDLATPDPQYMRLMERDWILKSNHNKIKPVDYQQIQTVRWMEKCSEYLNEDYEGIILRDPNGRYSPLNILDDVKRPNCLLKFKPREKDTYLIIDTREGTGWASGMLGALQVKGNDTDPFWVGTGSEFTKEKRQLYWSQRTELIGKYLEVLHEPIRTVNGLPICTSGYKIITKPEEESWTGD